MTRKTFSLGNWLAALTLSVSAIATPGGLVCQKPVRDPNLKAQEALPHSDFHALGARAVGLFVGDMVEANQWEGRYSSDPTAIGLGADRSSYRYVLFQDKSLHSTEFQFIPVGNIPLGQPGAKEEKWFDLVMANPETIRPWNVKGKYALVEVEVNDGKMSPARTDRFVATKVTQLDRTAQYPLDASATVEALASCGDHFLAQYEPFLKAKMNESQVLALGAKQPSGPEESAKVLLPTWLTKEGLLEVRVYYQRTNGDYHLGCGAPGCTPSMRYGQQFGIRLLVSYLVDRNGRVVKATMSSVETFKRFLPPPPAPPRGPRP